MSRRSGQNGYIEKKGSAYYVRFWIDVPGQEQRVHKAVRICPVSGPGKMGKSERERRAKEIIAESGADTEQHFNAVQALNLGTTFEQQAAGWLRNIQSRKRRPVKPHTAATWAGYLRWINERIGEMPLASVNNSTAKQLVAEMAHAEFAPKTIKGYLQVVKAVVASAVLSDGEEMYPRKWNHDFIDLPMVERDKQNTPAFTSEQVTKIVAAESPYRMLYALLAGTGMRINEALALEIPNVSPDGSTITVKQGMWNGKVQSLKTINAYREIDLDEGLAKMLLAHVGPRKTGFVFRSSRGTPLQLAHVLCRDLHPIPTRA
jgi:integrase